MPEENYEYREFFLTQFTKELLTNSRTKKADYHPAFLTQTEIKKEIEAPIPSSFQVTKKFIPLSPPISQLKKIPPVVLNIHQPTPSIYSQTSPIKPSIELLPSQFNLGKLNLLIHDPKVNAIECPGPGKFLLVKVLGKVNTTRLSLSQAEIQGVIENFSRQTKIPIISGLFKAAVGNLVITAVISEIVGSRFIISKITPFVF